MCLYTTPTLKGISIRHKFFCRKGLNLSGIKPFTFFLWSGSNTNEFPGQDYLLWFALLCRMSCLPSFTQPTMLKKSRTRKKGGSVKWNGPVRTCFRKRGWILNCLASFKIQRGKQHYWEPSKFGSYRCDGFFLNTVWQVGCEDGHEVIDISGVISNTKLFVISPIHQSLIHKFKPWYHELLKF